MKRAELTVTEAAQLKGCTLKYIYDLLRMGRFVGARKVGRRWLIPEASVGPLDRQRERYAAHAASHSLSR
jgi:excisionase family DNA binding protein